MLNVIGCSGKKTAGFLEEALMLIRDIFTSNLHSYN